MKLAAVSDLSDKFPFQPHMAPLDRFSPARSQINHNARQRDGAGPHHGSEACVVHVLHPIVPRPAWLDWAMHAYLLVYGRALPLGKVLSCTRLASFK